MKTRAVAIGNDLMAPPGVAANDMPAVAELPNLRGPWRPEPDRLALLVHDTQPYFCRPISEDTPLDPAAAHMTRLIAGARGAGVPILYTAQKGDQFRLDPGLQADLRGFGMSATPEYAPDRI